LASHLVLLKKHEYHKKSSLASVFINQNLTRMHITNFLQKGLMTMAFVLIPIILTKPEYGFGWEKSELWMAYLPAMVAGLVAMGPAAVFGEKKNIPKQIFLISIVLFLVSFLIMGFTNSSTVFVLGVVAFFIAFNMMEPLVQSMISKFAKVHQKGAALGISNSAAYFFTFLGGTFAGLYLEISDREMLSMTITAVIGLWLIWTALKLQNPLRHSHLFIPQESIDFDKLNTLEHEHIAEWYINETENVVVIKYVTDAIEEDDLKAKVSK
jgi:MFS family permease